jgi:hypothetical protein
MYLNPYLQRSNLANRGNAVMESRGCERWNLPEQNAEWNFALMVCCQITFARVILSSHSKKLFPAEKCCVHNNRISTHSAEPSDQQAFCWEVLELPSI